MGPKAVISAMLMCAIFGANIVAIKISLRGMGPLTAAGIRFALAAVAIAAWAIVTRRSFALKKGQLGQLGILSAVFLFQMMSFYTGVKHTAASRGILLANLQPFIVLILAHIFLSSEKITARKALGILAGFTGVVVLIMQQHGITEEVRKGDFFVLAAVVLWASNAVYIKRIISEYKAFHIAFYPIAFITPFLFGAAFILEEPVAVHLDWSVVCALLYQGIVSAGAGFVVWNVLQKRYGVVTLHSFIFLVPISGVTFSALVLDEAVTGMNFIVSLVLITLGILLVNAGVGRERGA